jgi:hypothetical protein
MKFRTICKRKFTYNFNDLSVKPKRIISKMLQKTNFMKYNLLIDRVFLLEHVQDQLKRIPEAMDNKMLKTSLKG